MLCENPCDPSVRVFSPSAVPPLCLQGARVALEEEIAELERREGVLLGALSDEAWAEVTKTSAAVC